MADGRIPTMPPARAPVLGADGGSVSSWYGQIDRVRMGPDGRIAPHTGVDVVGRLGSDVASMWGGVVARVGRNALLGNFVEIEHDGGVASTYGHLQSSAVAVGATVEAGAAIGRLGMTGRASGPHVHVGVKVNGRRVDPNLYLGFARPPAAAPRGVRREAASAPRPVPRLTAPPAASILEAALSHHALRQEIDSLASALRARA